MKYYPNNIDRLINDIKNDTIKSLLFYGPDSGMISDLILKLASKLDLNITSATIESSEEFNIALNTRNIFNIREAIKIDLKLNKIDTEVKNILTSSNVNLGILIDEEISSGSSLRKFFESEKSLGIIPCYQDNAKSIRQIILYKLQECNKQISPDALDFLVQNLHGDRLLILNELAKLLSYISENPKIFIEDCKKTIGSVIETQPDKLCLYFAKKDAQNYLKELEVLLESSIPSVWIPRALARFYQNLLTVKFYEIDGSSIENAMTNLKPPIFFKIENDFKEIVSKLDINMIVNTLSLLSDCEIDAKNNQNHSCLDKLFISHFLKSD